MALSEERREYLKEYQKNKLKRIPLDVPREKYDEIKAAADSAGESVNGYIKKAIDDRMEHDGSPTAAADPQTVPQLSTEPKETPSAAVADGLPAYLTPDILSHIDRKRFLAGDMEYQIEIGSIIGMDHLSELSDYLKQQ